MLTSDEFIECDTCRSKSGSPLLCEGCQSNRALVASLTTELGALRQERDSLLVELGALRAKEPPLLQCTDCKNTESCAGAMARLFNRGRCLHCGGWFKVVRA